MILDFQFKAMSSQVFSVVRDFCGHGIGKKFHEVKYFTLWRKGEGQKLKRMIFTLEPMINEGILRQDKGWWTAVTKDKLLSAQFEHTVGITNNGCEIFTLSKKGLDFPPYKI